MTEAEWLACEDPILMLAVLRVASGRKLRLAACDFCRPFVNALTDERSRAAIACAERFADGGCTDEERDRHFREARSAWKEWTKKTPADPKRHIALAASDTTFRFGWDAAEGVQLDIGSHNTDTGMGWASDHARQARSLREIFGNPFRPVTFDPVWRTSDVMLLARGIYEERAFDRMPILADALQDAGCDNTDVLNHCRDPHATHVRGCWALDLVLGKG
jgi:hypothetical protein